MRGFNISRYLYYFIIPHAGLRLKTALDFMYGVHFPKLKKSLPAILIFLSATTYSYSQTLTPTYSDVDYVGNNVAHQKMDIYSHPGLAPPAPVIVFIHGGGWSGGSKGPANVPFFQQCYDSGFVCVDINYRLSTDSVWPAQIEDCKTAIRFLKANAKTYNIDISRFGVMGESAGGHLSAMLGVSAGVAKLEGLHLGYTNQSSRVQAVVDMYGPTDFLKEDGHNPASCGTSGILHEYMSYETQLLGIDSLHNNQTLVRTANPITYITSDDAHFFIIHGEEDCTVPVYQSKILDSILTVTGIKADTFIIATGQYHGSPYFKDKVRTELYNNFFLKYLSVPGTFGIKETIFQNICVYPNPATTEIKVDLPFINNYTLEIIDTYGTLVLKTQNQNTLNISKLKNGIYFLRLTSANITYTQKIIKQ